MGKKLGHKLETLGVRFLIGVATRLSPAGRRRLGERLGGLGARLYPRLLKVATENIRAAYPEWSEREVRRLALANIRHLGAVSLEFLGVARTSAEDFRPLVRIKNPEVMDEVMAGGKGAFLLGMHLGNWEYAGLAVRAYGYPTNAIGKKMSNKRVDALVNGIRQRFGSNIFGHRDAVRPVLKALKDGQCVGFLLDQRARGKEWVASTFMGRPVATNQGLAILALRTGAPVVFTKCVWTGERYEFTFGPVVEPPKTEDREEAVAEFTRSFDRLIEAAVREHPEQWFWVHKRWRLPDGFPE